MSSAFAGRTEQVREDAGKLVEDLGAVRDTAGRLLSDVREAWSAFGIQDRLERHPIGTVAAAAGVGFVLGGGLFRPLVSRMIRTGIKLALVPYLKTQLFNYAASALNREQGTGNGEQGM